MLPQPQALFQPPVTLEHLFLPPCLGCALPPAQTVSCPNTVAFCHFCLLTWCLSPF